MRIPVIELIVGDILIKDSYSSTGLHLLSAGTAVDSSDIKLLARHQVDDVDIRPRETEVSENFVNDFNKISPEQTSVFHHAIDGIKALFQCAGSGHAIHTEAVEAAFYPLIQQCSNEKDVVSLLLSLDSQDDYTYQHSVQVGMLSFFIAKWLHQTDDEALIAGNAGFLHDIGKSKIDPGILQKPDKLTNNEYAEIKKHTVFGYEMIRKSLQNQSLAIAALQHHERMDGSGYPLRKKGNDIHNIARIVAVADVYSAMICNRVYQQKRDLLAVLKELHRMSFGELDPHITQVFIKHMIPHFIGKRVRLTDGRAGIIIMTNPSDFFRPLVQIGHEFLDLSQTRHVDITAIAM